MDFEELDYRVTPLGEISLRRRSEPMAGGHIVYEVKLGDEFLMSSLFTEAESELARLALAALQATELDIVVGGLGLGYTAAAVLESPRVRTLRVVEVVDAVIEWHERGLVPLGATLTSDPRCTLTRADFFELATAPGAGFDPAAPERRVHAVLLDIDHAPNHWLDSRNSAFYTASALRSLAAKLHTGGIFGMWSNEPPEGPFTELLESVFQTCEPHIVTFPNPYTGGQSSSTVYLATKRSGNQ